MSARPDLRTTYWTNVIRPMVLHRDRWCPGVPAGYHRGEQVPTTAVDHLQPGIGLTGDPRHDLHLVRGLCGACNSQKAVAYEGAWRWQR